MLYVLGRLLYYLADAYVFLILIKCIMTWLPLRGGTPLFTVYEALSRIVDPYLDLFRKFIPPVGGTIDFSPIIALLVLQFVVRMVARLLCAI